MSKHYTLRSFRHLPLSSLLQEAGFSTGEFPYPKQRASKR